MSKARLPLFVLIALVTVAEQLVIRSNMDEVAIYGIFAGCFLLVASGLVLIAGTFGGQTLPSGEIQLRAGSIAALIVDNRRSLCSSYWMTVLALFAAAIILGMIGGGLSILLETIREEGLANTLGVVLAVVVGVIGALLVIVGPFMLYGYVGPVTRTGKISGISLIVFYYAAALPFAMGQLAGGPLEAYKGYGILIGILLAILVLAAAVGGVAWAGYKIAQALQQTWVGRAFIAFKTKTCPVFVA